MNCACFREIHARCSLKHVNRSESFSSFFHERSFKTHVSGSDVDDDIGRVAYTVAILTMFGLIILILMFRSIKRNTSTVEVESLLDAMRFREELDLRERQRRRLLKAKTKVKAWLTRSKEDETEMWRYSGPKTEPKQRHSSSITSEVPEIVVTEATFRTHTPALSLMFDFDESPRASLTSMYSDSLDIDCYADRRISRTPRRSLFYE